MVYNQFQCCTHLLEWYSSKNIWKHQILWIRHSSPLDTSVTSEYSESHETETETGCSVEL